MGRRALAIAALMFAIGVPLLAWRMDDRSRGSARPENPPISDESALIVNGRVQQVHGPRLFTIDRGAADPEWLVFVPNAEATPLAGTRVTVRGVLRPFTDAEVETTDDWSHVDTSARDEFMSRPVLVATSLVTSTGRQLARRAAGSAGATVRSFQEASQAGRVRDDRPIPMFPGMLADQVVTLAGHAVRVTNARVVGVFNQQAFLIETQASLLPLVGLRARVLVLIENRALRVAPELLVASTVTVSGIARTLLGMQVSREVPWPPVLTRELIQHLEIRAALLAKSVQTPEGDDVTTVASDALAHSLPSSGSTCVSVSDDDRSPHGPSSRDWDLVHRARRGFYHNRRN